MTYVIMAVFVAQHLALPDVQKNTKKQIGFPIFFRNNGLERKYLQVLEEKLL